MKSWIGIDPAQPAIRTSRKNAETGEIATDCIYRFCGAGKTKEYQSGEKWGDPFAFREHSFGRFEDGVDKVCELRFLDPLNPAWMKGYFGGRRHFSAANAGTDGTITIAIPDGTPARIQDEYLAATPGGFKAVNLLWRPVAMVMHWLKGLTQEERESFEGSTVTTLDLDGGRPEIARLTITRHREQREWLIPARRAAIICEETEDNAFEKELLAGAFEDFPEYKQLAEGIFAGRLQELLESRERYGEAWIRKGGAWTKCRFDIPHDAPDGVWKAGLNPLFKKMIETNGGKKINADDVLLVNGWAARRFRRRIEGAFERFGCRVETLEAGAVAEGARLFSERRDKGLPTYYDTAPDYRLFDGNRFEFVSIFGSGGPLEPGEELRSRAFDLKMGKNSNTLGIYVQNRGESNRREFARRLKVTLSRFADEETPLRLTARVAAGMGSAAFTFEMTDSRQEDIFMVDDKPSRRVEFRYTVESSGEISGEPEPKHKGYPEPQPVLGRVYDSAENLEMLQALLADPREKKVETRAKTVAYRRRAGFSKKDELISSRVGYDANPRQPTRGLLGTARLPNRPEAEQACREFAKMEYRNPEDTAKRQNYCHSFAVEEYKEAVRRMLKTGDGLNSFVHCYAPGYVLGDKEGDINILLEYLCKPGLAGGMAAILWWSVFRMLCWHPESTISDAGLAEKALTRLAEKHAHTFNQRFGDNERKFAALAVLYMLRLRENGGMDLSDETEEMLTELFSGGCMGGIKYPKTMLVGLPNPDAPPRELPGTLSEYVVKFLRREDTIAERELGAKMGCV